MLASRAVHSSVIDYQMRALEFAPGDVAVLSGDPDTQAGRVVAVWPAIGMVDIEFPGGNKRYPVEDLQRLDANAVPIPPFNNSVPGGAGTVEVAGGKIAVDVQILTNRVAHAFVKKALYWAERDRRYRVTSEELGGAALTCPKCKEAQLRKAIYKRRKGQSEHLLGCPTCLFLIKREDILGLEMGRQASLPKNFYYDEQPKWIRTQGYGNTEGVYALIIGPWDAREQDKAALKQAADQFLHDALRVLPIKVKTDPMWKEGAKVWVGPPAFGSSTAKRAFWLTDDMTAKRERVILDVPASTYWRG